MNTPSNNEPVTRHEMTYPSGGVVLLDAGTLLAASPAELAALQSRLRDVAESTTPDGHPFRAQTEDTSVGDLFVAPVRERDVPHTVKVVRENGRARRVVIELDGPDGGGELAVLRLTPSDAPGHAEPGGATAPSHTLHVPPPVAPDETLQPGESGAPGLPLKAALSPTSGVPRSDGSGGQRV